MDQARESLAELAAVTRALNELQATAFDLDYGVDIRKLADAAIKELEEQYPDYQIATHLEEVRGGMSPGTTLSALPGNHV